MSELGRSAESLVNYWKQLEPGDKMRLAARLNTSVDYLRQVFLYARPVGGVLARRLSDSTNIPAGQFRPDIFGPSTGRE
jgi:hypothetical protein